MCQENVKRKVKNQSYNQDIEITKLSTLKTLIHQISAFQSVVAWCQSWKQHLPEVIYFRSSMS